MPGPITAPPLPPGIGTAPEMISILDLAKKKGVCIGIHAPSGYGKTSLLRTLPAERTLAIDIDGGVGGLSDPGKPGTPYEGLPPWNGTVVTIDDKFSNLKQTVDWLSTANPPLTKQGNPITTVVLDSGSHMEKRMIYFYAGTSEVGIRHYGDAAVSARRCLFALRDLTAKGINVILMFHTRTDVKGSEGIRTPALSDKLALEVVGMCDAVAYLSLEPDQVTRKLQFAPTLNVVAKSRFAQIRDWEILDLGDIIGRVLGARRLPPAPVVPVPPPVVVPPAVKVEAPKTDIVSTKGK